MKAQCKIGNVILGVVPLGGKVRILFHDENDFTDITSYGIHLAKDREAIFSVDLSPEDAMKIAAELVDTAQFLNPRMGK